MSGRVHHAKISFEDAVDMRAALTKLDAIHDSVNATGMAGKAAILELCIQVYRLLERMLAKEYRAVGSYLEAQNPPAPFVPELAPDPVQQAPDAPTTPPAGGKGE